MVFIWGFVLEASTGFERKFQMEIMHTCLATDVFYSYIFPCRSTFFTWACLSSLWLQRIHVGLEHLVTDTFSSATDQLFDLGKNIFLLGSVSDFSFFKSQSI